MSHESQFRPVEPPSTRDVLDTRGHLTGQETDKGTHTPSLSGTKPPAPRGELAVVRVYPTQQPIECHGAQKLNLSEVAHVDSHRVGFGSVARGLAQGPRQEGHEAQEVPPLVPTSPATHRDSIQPITCPGGASESAPLPAVWCSWCNRLIASGSMDMPVSHGICLSCRRAFVAGRTFS